MFVLYTYNWMRQYGDVQIEYFVVHIRVYQTLFAFKFIYLDCNYL